VAEGRSGTVPRLRWSVVRALLDPAVGHEQAGPRPVLVVSNEPFNRLTDLATVLPLTTARRQPRATEVLLPAGVAGLPVASLVLTGQVRTIAQARFRPPLHGRITEGVFRRRIAAAVLRHLLFDDLDLLEDEP
jgi:mRNA-degrading endonuclease toxin of MazEF toxin-antitoxin module